MSLNPPQCLTRGLTASLVAVMLLVSCATPAPPERPAAPSSELSFDAGVDYAIDDLLVQARRLPAFSASSGLIKSDVPRGVIAVEMEASALFYLAMREQARGQDVRGACILTVSDTLIKDDDMVGADYMALEDLEKATVKMIEIALEAGTSLL